MKSEDFLKQLERLMDRSEGKYTALDVRVIAKYVEDFCYLATDILEYCQELEQEIEELRDGS